MNRRSFLANLGIGAAALILRFRPESGRELSRIVASGEFGEYRWNLISAFRPVLRNDFERIVIHRCPPEKPNYFGPLQWINFDRK